MSPIVKMLIANKKKMNCKEANQLSIVDFLSSIGHNPKYQTSANAKYCSPFRNESFPSFNVNLSRNLWIDFGTSQRGTLIDLVCLIYNTDITQALQIVSGKANDFILSKADPYENLQQKEPAFRIIDTKPISHPALENYLLSRCIPVGLGKVYLKEVHFTMIRKNRDYFALGFKNDKGGYEIRNKKLAHPYCISPKYFTTITIEESSQLNIFEGFFDFLSYLKFYNIRVPKCTTIVLNGLGMLSEIENDLQSYSQINLFLDNDTVSQAGQKAAIHISKIHPNVKDYSKTIYREFKDFNEYICRT